MWYVENGGFFLVIFVVVVVFLFELILLIFQLICRQEVLFEKGTVYTSANAE